MPDQNQTGKVMHEDFSLVDRECCGNMNKNKAQQCT
jgi:hypothetical protein